MQSRRIFNKYEPKLIDFVEKKRKKEKKGSTRVSLEDTREALEVDKLNDQSFAIKARTQQPSPIVVTRSYIAGSKFMREESPLYRSDTRAIISNSVNPNAESSD